MNFELRSLFVDINHTSPPAEQHLHRRFRVAGRRGSRGCGHNLLYCSQLRSQGVRRQDGNSCWRSAGGMPGGSASSKHGPNCTSNCITASLRRWKAACRCWRFSPSMKWSAGCVAQIASQSRLWRWPGRSSRRFRRKSARHCAVDRPCAESLAGEDGGRHAQAGRPDGHRPSQTPAAIVELQLRDFCGIGPQMQMRLERGGIFNVEQLCLASEEQLSRLWGSRVIGSAWWRRLRGEDVRNLHAQADFGPFACLAARVAPRRTGPAGFDSADSQSGSPLAAPAVLGQVDPD